MNKPKTLADLFNQEVTDLTSLLKQADTRHKDTARVNYIWQNTTKIFQFTYGHIKHLDTEAEQLEYQSKLHEVRCKAVLDYIYPIPSEDIPNMENIGV